MVLDADTALIVKIKKADGYTGDMEISVKDEKGKAVSFTEFTLADGRTQVSIGCIAAHMLGNTYTVSVKTAAGTSTEDKTITLPEI